MAKGGLGSVVGSSRTDSLSPLSNPLSGTVGNVRYSSSSALVVLRVANAEVEERIGVRIGVAKIFVESIG